ncbi:Protein of unknown function [Propionibacterium freudenreichii]|nr:Protein of unknown function [Propionibacterium freudenreichii]
MWKAWLDGNDAAMGKPTRRHAKNAKERHDGINERSGDVRAWGCAF